jgi:hypothetical protein
MKRNFTGIVLGVVTLIAVASFLPGCGFKRKLVAITVTPDGVQVTGTGVIVNFKAVGSYIHPPDTRDITDSVLWESAAPQIMSIDPHTGVATSGAGCGSNIGITATAFTNAEAMSGTAVIGQALISVTQASCP